MAPQHQFAGWGEMEKREALLHDYIAAGLIRFVIGTVYSVFLIACVFSFAISPTASIRGRSPR